MKLGNRSTHVLIVIGLLVLSGGCLTSSKKEDKPKVYVTPCNVASKGIQLSISGSKELNDKTMKVYVPKVFVDDFDAPSGKDMVKTLTMTCYWGTNPGENRDLYYCAGKYKAPQMDESRTITRNVWKEYKVGFSVEKHDIGTWVDSSGTVHKSEAVYYLTVKDVIAKCYKA